MTEDDLPVWVHGSADCNACGYRWVAVWKLGADPLECPVCHSQDTGRELHEDNEGPEDEDGNSDDR